MAVRATDLPSGATIVPTTSDEPFYGWRSVRQKAKNGRYEYVLVPLSYDDLLNPQEGDQVIHSTKHQRIVRTLCNAIEAQLSHDPTALVLDDVLVDWGIPDLRNHAPDISVYFGVRERKNWTTFRVSEEGVRPTILIEIVSPETARHDRKTKVQEYHRAGVPYYILVDFVRERRQERLVLVGYRWAPAGYEPLEHDAAGSLWLGPVRLWLGIDNNEIVCRDEAGQQLGDYAAQVLRTEAEFQARMAEVQARVATEARLRQLEAELRRLRGDD